jgi:hypothetical protein
MIELLADRGTLLPGPNAQLGIPGIPFLNIVDVVGAQATSERIGQLQDIHHRYFPDYPHVTQELAADATGAGPYPGVVVHQWLFLRDNRPVGIYIFHTNTARGVLLRHFLALDEPARRGLPLLWLGWVSERLVRIGEQDCVLHGTELIASASEIHQQLFHHWRRLGSRQLVELPYAEPAHGMHWSRHGHEPEFWPITLNLKRTNGGRQLSYPLVVQAALRAFLLDHYRLPPDNPRVREILAAAQTLTDTSE